MIGIYTSMQEQIWSWTPAKELEPEISLLKPSTLLSSVRFNEYRRSVSIPSLRAAAENVVEKIEYTVMDGDDIQMSDISQQDKKSEKTLKSHFKLVKGNRAIHKDMSEHMAVPIQPRKGLSVIDYLRCHSDNRRLLWTKTSHLHEKPV